MLRKIQKLRVIKLCPISVVGPVYAKAPMFDGRTHWATYLRHEAAARLNKWSEEEKGLPLILGLKGPAAELLQVPSDSQNTYVKLTKALKLWYGNQQLCKVYHVQLKLR